MAGGEQAVKVEAYGQSYDAFSSASLSRFLTLNVLIGAKPQALLMRDDRTTISAFRVILPSSDRRIPSWHEVRHEMDAMAAIFGAKVAGLSTRGQRVAATLELDPGG